MSKNHREARRPKSADWTVHLIPGQAALVTEATYRRDDKGGYTFTDSRGICADFPPGTVLHVMRKEPVSPEAVFEFSRDPADALEALDSRA